MGVFEKLCKKANSELSNYTLNQCVKMGLRMGPQKRNNAPTNYQRINAAYANVRSRNQLNPALSFLAKKRAGNNVQSNAQKLTPNGRGGWKKEGQGKGYNGQKWTPNGRGGWKKAGQPNGRNVSKKATAVAANKKQPMKCKCKANVNGKKYCMCNVPDLPQIHNKWVLTNF